MRRAPSPVARRRANMMEASRIVLGTTSHCARKRPTFSRWVLRTRQRWDVCNARGENSSTGDELWSVYCLWFFYVISVFLRPEMWVYWSSHGRHGVRRVGALVREIARRITTPCTTESVWATWSSKSEDWCWRCMRSAFWLIGWFCRQRIDWLTVYEPIQCARKQLPQEVLRITCCFTLHRCLDVYIPNRLHVW